MKEGAKPKRGRPKLTPDQLAASKKKTRARKRLRFKALMDLEKAVAVETDPDGSRDKKDALAKANNRIKFLELELSKTK